MQLQNIILCDSNAFSGEDKNWSGMAAFQPTDCNALQEKKISSFLNKICVTVEVHSSFPKLDEFLWYIQGFQIQ